MYNNNTPGTYKIPYWAKGERSSGASNLRAAQIIENQIRANNQFFGANGVIQEGLYSGAFSPGASIVQLIANSAIPPLEGVIAYKYVRNNASLLWTGLPDSSTIYLYAQAIEQDIYAANQLSTLQDMICVTTWNTTGVTPSESILLAKATTSTTDIAIDSSASITDNGEFTGGKPIYYSFGAHRTAIPLDHPDESVTDIKMADEAVLSRSLAPWDGLSSGTDTVNGKGVATGHIKNAAISTQKLDLSQGLNINILGNIDLTGYARFSSGLQAGTIVATTIVANNIISTSTSVVANLVSGVTVIGGLRGYDRTLLYSGLDVYGPTILHGTTLISGLNANVTLRGNLTVSGTTTLTNLTVAGNLAVAGDIVGQSGVSAAAGYAGKVAFYRLSLGHIDSPLDPAGNDILMPTFPFPATVTELLVTSRHPVLSSDFTFNLENALNGGGSTISATIPVNQRYASGLGALPLAVDGNLSFYPANEAGITTSFLSGLDVFISGYQTIPLGSQ